MAGLIPGKSRSRRRHVVVNADDFGMTPEINSAIVRAFTSSLISSATIMANMPAFEDACLLARSYGLSGRLGLHLNFTSGAPLSPEAARCPRFCDAGGCWLPRRSVFTLTAREQAALESEVTAQVAACERNGITPTHWDSHHHMHTQPAFARVVLRTAKRLKVAAIRPALNFGPGRAGASKTHVFLARTYRDIFNRWLHLQGLAHVAWFAAAQDAADLVRNSFCNMELMVHPMLNEVGELVDSDGCLLQERMASLSIPRSQMGTYHDVLREALSN